MSASQAFSCNPSEQDSLGTDVKTLGRVKSLSKRKRPLTEDYLNRTSTSPGSSRVRQCDRFSSQEFIDLTRNVQRCALCSNPLGEGEDRAARIYLLHGCRCVICGQCALSDIPDDHFFMTHLVRALWCPRHDHFDFGSQKIHEIFNLDCQICLDNTAEKFDRPYQEIMAANPRTEREQCTSGQSAPPKAVYDVVRVSTLCGHSFCRNCVTGWTESRPGNGQVKCPVCRKNIPGDVSKLQTFDTVQYDVVSQSGLAVKDMADDETPISQASEVAHNTRYR